MGVITYQDNTLLSYDQWLLARNASIGASEFGAIVFGSKWTSNLEIFYQKIGAPFNKVENIRMYLGKETEDISAKMWGYYEGTEQSVVDNARRNRIVKQCEFVNQTGFNSDFPFLSATPDRIIQPYGKYEGRGKGCLEIKNTMSYVLKSYENSLPPENIIQLVGQNMVWDLDYGEIFYFIDNSKFELYPIERADTKNIEEIILAYTTPFWENVLKARPIYNAMFEAQRNSNQRLVNKLEKEIAALEPPVQNTIAYRDYLSVRYKDRLAGAGVKPGTPGELVLAQKHRQLSKDIEAIEKQQMAIEIEIKQSIGDMSALDFGKSGSVTWYADKDNKRRFLNKVK